MQAQMGGLESAFKTADNSATVNKENGVYEVNYKGEDILISDDYRYIEKVEASIDEWNFNQTTQTLTAYKWDLATKRGNQEIGEVIIPNYYNGKRVKGIGNNLFYNNSLKSYLTKVTISDGIETIGGGAFMGCENIKGDLIIPDSITHIGDMAFLSCGSLNGKIKLSNNLQNIGVAAFKYCGNLKGDLIIPDSVTYIGSDAFACCYLLDGTLKLSGNIEKIESQTFYGCKLKGDIVLSEKVNKIGWRAFYSCSSINSIKILNKNIEIEDISETVHDTFASTIRLIVYEGSTAETYAIENDITFENIK